MNTVYFGRGAYGIDAAARTYFKRKVGSPPAQSALLAGVIRSPEFYGREHAASAKARRDYILQAMVDRGWLSAKDGRAAIASKLGVSGRRSLRGSPTPGRPSTRRRSASTWSGATARGGQPAACGPDHLGHEDAGPGRPDGQADPRRPEERPEGAPWSRSTRATGPCGPCTAAGTTSPASSTTLFNAVCQAGSTMKPFTARPGPERRLLGQHELPRPGGADRQRRGLQELRRHQLRPDDVRGIATRLSVNTVYVQAHAGGEAGAGGQARQGARPDRRARRRGRAEEGPGGRWRSRPCSSRCWPSRSAPGRDHPPALASAFGTWANRGIHHTPHLVEWVTDAKGRVLEEHPGNPQGEQQGIACCTPTP